MSMGWCSTPTAIANAGQRSLTSNKKVDLLILASPHAERLWNMGGEVPQTISTSLTLKPAINDETMKLKKLNIR
jgi:hypothetical protein